MGGGGVEVDGGVEREVQTTYVVLPSSEAPSSIMVDAQAREIFLGLPEERSPERLIVCTIQDETLTALATPTSPSSTGGQTAPAHGQLRNSDMRKVEYYDSLIIRGGESHVLLPKRLETGYQKFTESEQRAWCLHMLPWLSRDWLPQTISSMRRKERHRRVRRVGYQVCSLGGAG